MNENEVGALITFPARVSKEEVEKLIREMLVKTGGSYIVREYNPEYGGPVWYIP
jgi:hypothetical protein